MVYRPGEKKLPEFVPNSYIAMCHEGANFDEMVRDIEKLIRDKGRESDCGIARKSPGMGAVLLNCDAALAQQIKALPSIAHIESNGVAGPARSRPKGPGAGM